MAAPVMSSDKDSKKERDRDRDDKKPKPPAERTGHVAPADPALVEFLERLWTRENPPERLELWRVVGANRDVRRAMVFYENFKQEDKLDIERCTRLAGEILSAAQNDCDCAERRSLYEIAIMDPYQKTQPLLRRLGPLTPQRAYAGTRPDGEPKGVEDEEDEEAIGIKPIGHKYLTKTFRAMERMMGQVHAVIGDTMQLQQGIIISQQSHQERLQNANMALYEQNQTANDRALDREISREKEKMKIKAIGTGLKVGENAILGWFGADAQDGDRKALGSGPNGHGASKERSLIASFLEECEQEKISVDLFGDWQAKEEMTIPEVSAGVGLLKQGVFTPAQFGLLLGVASGQLSADALDALMPGGSQPITPEQMMLAQPMLTQSMWMALQQVKQIRDEKREAKAEKGEQK